MKQKKIPLRKCLGCGCQKPKQELVRVVRSAEGEVSLDLTGKKAGRGKRLISGVADAFHKKNNVRNQIGEELRGLRQW